MTRIAELIERVKAATESDTAELFGDACRVLLPHNWWIDGNRLHHFLREGAYTDAALALCERVHPGCAIEQASFWPSIVGGEQDDNRHAYVSLLPLDARGYGDQKRRTRGAGSILPLAILLALLLSLESAP